MWCGRRIIMLLYQTDTTTTGSSQSLLFFMLCFGSPVSPYIQALQVKQFLLINTFHHYEVLLVSFNISLVYFEISCRALKFSPEFRIACFVSRPRNFALNFIFFVLLKSEQTLRVHNTQFYFHFSLFLKHILKTRASDPEHRTMNYFIDGWC